MEYLSAKDVLIYIRRLSVCVCVCLGRHQGRRGWAVQNLNGTTTQCQKLRRRRCARPVERAGSQRLRLVTRPRCAKLLINIDRFSPERERARAPALPRPHPLRPRWRACVRVCVLCCGTRRHVRCGWFPRPVKHFCMVVHRLACAGLDFGGGRAGLECACLRRRKTFSHMNCGGNNMLYIILAGCVCCWFLDSAGAGSAHFVCRRRRRRRRSCLPACLCAWRVMCISPEPGPALVCARTCGIFIQVIAS